jgi:hypothetical protein
MQIDSYNQQHKVDEIDDDDGRGLLIYSAGSGWVNTVYTPNYGRLTLVPCVCVSILVLRAYP